VALNSANEAVREAVKVLAGYANRYPLNYAVLKPGGLECLPNLLVNVRFRDKYGRCREGVAQQQTRDRHAKNNYQGASHGDRQQQRRTIDRVWLDKKGNQCEGGNWYGGFAR